MNTKQVNGQKKKRTVVYCTTDSDEDHGIILIDDSDDEEKKTTPSTPLYTGKHISLHDIMPHISQRDHIKYVGKHKILFILLTN